MVKVQGTDEREKDPRLQLSNYGVNFSSPTQVGHYYKSSQRAYSFNVGPHKWAQKSLSGSVDLVTVIETNIDFKRALADLFI